MNQKEFDESWPLSLEDSQTPWLLYTHDHDDSDSSVCEQLQAFYSPGDSKSHMKSIPELCHKDAIAFFHGWLILRDQEDRCIYSLFNITTLQTTSLPRLPTDDVSVGGLPVCLLTSSPSPADDNCMFLLSIVSDICDSLLFFCRPWANTCDFSIGSLLEYCGCIYYAKILERCINYHRELNNIVAIKVWELNLEEKNWMELKSLNGRAFLLNPRGSTWCWGNNAKVGGNIGNYIFFISKTSCYSIVSSDPTMRNKIYLPKIEGNNIVFYSLNTKMYHILESGDSKENLYGTNQPLMCC